MGISASISYSIPNAKQPIDGFNHYGCRRGIYHGSLKPTEYELKVHKIEDQDHTSTAYQRERK